MTGDDTYGEVFNKWCICFIKDDVEFVLTDFLDGHTGPVAPQGTLEVRILNETNSEGELGLITAFGGGSFNASSGVGVWGDFVVYYPRLSGMSQNNYGHYHTARRSGSNQQRWVSAGYTHNADGTVLPYYLTFRR